MLKIALLDDNNNDLLNLKNLLMKCEINLKTEFKIDLFYNGIDFLDKIKNDYDIIFLDIDMPIINGLEVAKKLRKNNQNITIIFVTYLASLAINGYEVNAYDFLVKPVNEIQLTNILNKVISNRNLNDKKKITLKIKGGYAVINPSDIMYIEILGHNLMIHSTNGIHETRGTLKEIEKALDNSKFSKCNSCYLVNLDYVNSVIGDEVILSNIKLPISRNKKKEFLEDFLENLE